MSATDWEKLLSLLGIVNFIDCRHFANRGSMAPRIGMMHVTCKRNGFQFPIEQAAGSFCSWGERRDGGLDA